VGGPAYHLTPPNTRDEGANCSGSCGCYSAIRDSLTPFLQAKKLQGEDKAIAQAVRPMNKPWVKLNKKQD